MALSTDEKKRIIKKFATVNGDTGSPEIQIALLTAKVKKLADHLKGHKKDVHSRRGLLSMISKRRRLLNYLLKEDQRGSGSQRYKKIIANLGLAK
ncbi:30S ribosomal protein S15 [Patescibacteria group bacterium]